MSGQVTYATGRSSMEITLQIAKASNSATDGENHIPEAVRPEDVFMTCAFTMVSLDPATKKPVNIAPLALSTAAERALYAKGEENHKAKKSLKESNIIQKAPDAEESALIHKMWTDSLAYADSKNPTNKPSNMTPMSKSILHSAQIMQPQYRNRHNFMIFGGYLLKQTFELAFTCAASFSNARPTFLNLDPSTFEAPVPVGSVLYVNASVTYTEPDSGASGTRIQVMVRTQVRNVEHSENERKSTGTFFYTFHVDREVSVLPESYSEFMRWVGGRRRAQRLAQNLEEDAKECGRVSVIGGRGVERVTE
jgi:acyl-coenzyme A thioesterase 9